ncbi:MAG: methyltransferase domain-containing protein [Gammaproteobacteria bacterium]|nr:methyltransferase domain-containing protein [Gammaproteobacteria bacterium]MCP5202086.1 methyltransferase domain-containing protein [Gammaproteobacteria bacterium]
MGLRSAHTPGDAVVAEVLEAWFASAPGERFAALEQHLLNGALPDLFGYHIVQLGRHLGADLLGATRISHRVVVDLGVTSTPGISLRGAEDALPFGAGLIDVLVLPHVLEFTDDPRRVLREAERVLIGEGHIVVLGFNPWSWYGLWSLARRWQGRAPWTGHLVSVSRLKDWLQLLGFDIVLVRHAGFRPPMRSQRLERLTAFSERLGAYCCPPLGGVYLVVGKKRVEGVTPLRVSWRQRRRVLAGGMVEPSTRGYGGAPCTERPR